MVPAYSLLDVGIILHRGVASVIAARAILHLINKTLFISTHHSLLQASRETIIETIRGDSSSDFVILIRVTAHPVMMLLNEDPLQLTFRSPAAGFVPCGKNAEVHFHCTWDSPLSNNLPTGFLP